MNLTILPVSKFRNLAAKVISMVMVLGACNDSSALEGLVRAVSFTGPVTHSNITFSIYLPPGYTNPGNTNRYPVVYHLHGIGGAHNARQTSLVPTSLEAAVAAKLVEPCIIVFPDGYRDSFWADSRNSFKPAETNVKQEIIPYVDANYRTVTDCRHRVIQGFSMGGFGAAKFAVKFPDTFCACVIYDGALLNWEGVKRRHPRQAAEIFDDSAEQFALESPWHWLPQNDATVRATVRMRDSVGALVTYNRAWRDLLEENKVPLDYNETGCRHTLGCLLDEQGAKSWEFIAAVFAGTDEGGDPHTGVVGESISSPSTKIEENEK